VTTAVLPSTENRSMPAPPKSASTVALSVAP
jgi:hypothetical protein